MRIAMIGTGYVGLVSGACFSEFGTDVVCVDKDAGKIDRLLDDVMPIYEPGLDALVEKNVAAGRLSFTTELEEAVRGAEAVFIAVGTPTTEGDGHADLSHVRVAAEEIAHAIDGYTVVVTKSTVPVGTGREVHKIISGVCSADEFDIASNPEFLREGSAIEDFMRPDRVVIGTDSEKASDVLAQLYRPLYLMETPILYTKIETAELIKYAANTFLAAKITFINEIANIAEAVGADVELVRKGMGSDPRIGYQFIYPGAGYGGSCFPKDVQALDYLAKQSGTDAQILPAVHATNEQQKRKLPDHVMRRFGPDLSGRTIGVWGLSFKPNTDDMREAPSRVLVEAIWAAGGRVKAFDPQAMAACEQLYGQRDDMTYCNSKEDAIDDADCLVICTEWKAFWAPDFEDIKRRLASPVIIDGRNLYNPAFMDELDIEYYGIGRGQSVSSYSD